ncbi:Hvo_1808 family surface protein [Haloplanus halobius]|uniref:Hvo_1808 family surface protein n=1 Tax=Haloplanus halobius TaxID=2934938 RepID=UPI0020104CB0|nr:Hvo_1808 family surface protein [Haloplanus sp. XH21]
MRGASLLLALLVVLAGCGGGAMTERETATPTPTETASTATEPATATPTATTPDPSPADFGDPAADRLGWEAGYWYDEPLAINASNGLNESERSALVARTMARVERLRGLEFESTVPVEVVSRTAYRTEENVTATAWDEQVWEALLLVGEDRSVAEVFRSLYGESVQGSYVPSEDRIVLVSETAQPTIDRQTLAHELVHALQDQQFGAVFDRENLTRDTRLARQGLIEGDAGYVAERYEQRCSGDWSCVARPPAGPGGSLGDDMGVYVAAYQPYSDGPAFVHRLRQRDGWAAVNAAYDDPPTSTSQVIHPERYPDWSATTVRIPDRSTDDWERFERSPAGETVGEASVFATLWANGEVETFHLQQTTRPYRAYNYTHSTSTGWVGDRIVPYRNGDGAYGYVFRTEWATEGDAAAFAIAYRRLLRTRRGAERREGNVLVVPAGPYADAFRVTRNGTTVTVVNAPTVAELGGVHAG